MTATPRRIQRQRLGGWQMPTGAVYVGRPSRWGNPHRHQLASRMAVTIPGAEERDSIVDRYRADLLGGKLPYDVDDVIDELAGKDLVCWCPLDMPCHADVLLEVANEVNE